MGWEGGSEVMEGSKNEIHNEWRGEKILMVERTKIGDNVERPQNEVRLT